jgi:hypothetical protein
MAIEAPRYIRFRGDDGMTILQRADEISTIMAGQRKPTNNRPAAKVVWLVLKNNNRVEVLGETVSTVLEKLHVALGFPPIVTGELPEDINPKETADA